MKRRGCMVLIAFCNDVYQYCSLHKQIPRRKVQVKAAGPAQARKPSGVVWQARCGVPVQGESSARPLS
jgi:hypothetical protein